MRLIDADELINQGYEIVVDGWQYDTCNKSIDIDNIPTAYSVDKVVEELEQKKEEVQRMRNTCVALSDLEVCDIENVTYERAIEIVKQGGVDDDVCEWKLDGDNLTTGCGDYFNLYDNCTGKFKYCPSCGKKIKAVEQMDEDELRYCHHDDTDEYHNCLDYMECEECPYYYADLDRESD